MVCCFSFFVLPKPAALTAKRLSYHPLIVDSSGLNMESGMWS